MTSALLIIPAPLQAAANAVGEAMGWGPENYTVPITTDGTTITHYACRTDVYTTFFVVLLAAGYDLTKAEMTIGQIEYIKSVLDSMPDKPDIPSGASYVLGALDIDLSEILWGAEHAQEALLKRNMTIVQG